MTLEAEQTAAVVQFLEASCPICLVPCDPDIHKATLRLRGPGVAKIAFRRERIDRGRGFKNSLLNLKTGAMKMGKRPNVADV